MSRKKPLSGTNAKSSNAAAAKSKSTPARAAQLTGARVESKNRRRKIVTDLAPKPVGPYNQAIVVGDTIYVAGQGPIHPRTGKIVSGGFEAQAAQTFENIKSILEAAGASMSDVVKVNVYLSDLSDFSRMNEIYKRYFPEDYPARSTIAAQLLFHLFIEVDCIAVKGSS